MNKQDKAKIGEKLKYLKYREPKMDIETILATIEKSGEGMILYNRNFYKITKQNTWQCNIMYDNVYIT